MANVEKLSVALTPDMAAELRAAVAAGDYGSVSEVVRDALRDWRLRRKIETLEAERTSWACWCAKASRAGLASRPGRRSSGCAPGTRRWSGKRCSSYADPFQGICCRHDIEHVVPAQRQQVAIARDKKIGLGSH
jgi:antitoxin ParD1/3/4